MHLLLAIHLEENMVPGGEGKVVRIEHAVWHVEGGAPHTLPRLIILCYVYGQAAAEHTASITGRVNRNTMNLSIEVAEAKKLLAAIDSSSAASL